MKHSGFSSTNAGGGINELAMGNNVFIQDSTVSTSARLYHRASIIESVIHDNVIIGENSRVKESHIEKYVSIDRNNFVGGATIGKYSYTGPFDMVFRTIIGSFCSISYGVTIGPPEHDFNRLTSHPFIYDSKYGIFKEDDLLPTAKFDKNSKIGNDVWIGCNATILRGVIVGDGAVIGANALVDKDIPPYAIAVGVPAKVIKYRFSQEIIDTLLEIKWWDWNEKKILLNADIIKGIPSLEKLKAIKNE